MAAPKELQESAARLVESLVVLDVALSDYVSLENDLRNRGLLPPELDSRIFGLSETMFKSQEALGADLSKLVEILGQTGE